MKAIVIQESGVIQVGEVPKPELQKDDEVLVKVAFSGLCGSDIPRVFHEGAHYYPIVLGHEFSGIVSEIADGITDINVGDKVCCVPLHPCLTCDECQKGFYSLCKKYGFVGSRSQGGNAEYVVVARRNLFVLPPEIDLKKGAFMEPVTVGLHAILLAGGCEGKNVVVVGVGTIGLLALQCAKAMGATSITAIDISTERLKLAASLGADRTINSMEMSADQQREFLNSSRFDQLILETAGTPQTVLHATAIAGPRAQIALVGTLHKDLTMSQQIFGQILRKELQILGCWMNYSAPFPGKEWEMAARFLCDGKIDTETLIQVSASFDDYVESVSALSKSAMTGKILLNTGLDKQ